VAFAVGVEAGPPAAVQYSSPMKAHQAGLSEPIGAQLISPYLICN
jgi:hypothetical protein